MADPKKNPLLESFKDPTPGTPSPEKPGEDKKPIEPPKETEAPTTPTKPAGGEKKATEGKPPAAPAKAEEGKKPTEPPKEAKAPTTPIKPAEGEKKATEGETPAAPLSDKDDELPADFHLDVVSKDNLGSVTLLPLSSIDDFEGHPFPVLDDKDMTDLVASIKQVGILEPTTVIRNAKKPGRFEMVAGHRRKHGAQLAGLDVIPAIVRDMDHDTAVIYILNQRSFQNFKLSTRKPLTGRRSLWLSVLDTITMSPSIPRAAPCWWGRSTAGIVAAS